jgi:ferrochelatase
MMNTDYQALLLVSFGGPEGPDEVMPFLENVLRGKNVPRERMLEVSHHYELFGGVSPINQQNRDLLSALRKKLQSDGPDLSIYWGNRNWHPYLADTLEEMKKDGVKRALAFVTSAYSSYSGCRQYLNDIDEAVRKVGQGAPEIDKLRVFYNHPGFVRSNVDHIRAALTKIPSSRRSESQLLFTAHSIPLSMAKGCEYEEQLWETARLTSELLPHKDWRLVYQSRSGPPHQPWLEPDILDAIEDSVNSGKRDIVLAPIGFISDHMEVIYDLDVEAVDLASKYRLNLVRASTVGTHPLFVEMIHELILERTEAAPKKYLGSFGPAPDPCPGNCCVWER